MTARAKKKPRSFDRLIRRCRDIVSCDTARISIAGGTMFFIVGERRHTKTDLKENPNAGQWYKNGKPIHFPYLAEKVVASGKTESELLASVKEYKKICGMTIIEYLYHKATQ